MCNCRKKDNRDAIPSWSGYEYQGQIAIIVVLEMLCTLCDNDINQYDLAIEDIEDFSIYRNGKRISIHQVKAVQNKDAISEYGEALYYMARGLFKRNVDSSVMAYLHTANELKYKIWKEEMSNAVRSFVPQHQKEYTGILDDDKKLEKEVIEFKSRLNKNLELKGNASKVRKEIFKYLPKLSNEEDITPDKLKLAIQQYLATIEDLDLSEGGVEDRILLYEYGSKKQNLSVDEAYGYILELIRQYWGEELFLQKKSSEKYYYFCLRDIIMKHVTERHMNPSLEIKIPFSRFREELKHRIISNKEQRLFECKDMFINEKKSYCQSCINKDCQKCDLEKVETWIEAIDDANKLERIFYMLSPDVNASLDNQGVILLHDTGLWESVFPTLQRIFDVKNRDDGKIIYNLNKTYLLTDITITKHKEEKVFQGISDNQVVEKICKGIVENRDFGPIRMEIDSMIVSNSREAEVEDIEERANHILLNCEDKELSYMKITHKKRVSMIDAEKFISDNEVR